MDLYYLPFASPSRAVVMTAAAVGVKPNRIVVNTYEKEQMKPEYVKLNPQHTVPTLVDNGFSVWESRAIMVYLAEKYGKDDSLYPKDPQKKALVNQRLHFDMGTLTHAFGEYYYPQFRKEGPADPEKLKKIEAAFEFLNTFLDGQKYVAGDNFTLADIAILVTVTTYLAVNFKIDAYPNVQKWYNSVQKEAPGWEENVEAAKEYTTRFAEAQKK
ncbi:hypothetical protein KR093_005982 [Drosophila rubida]|uniref:Uncharacterized protein n=1 Tax=Drosophila rubida TaxID=30044 RepID=A0AAD4KC85_9MUSC|nr:hypothetical protein KR093_005982 [Drosophila rubida]